MNKPTGSIWCLAAFLLLAGGPYDARAALSGPQVLEGMLKQLGPARTIIVRQRVENLSPAPESGSGPLAALGGEPSDMGAAQGLSDQAAAPAADAPADLPQAVIEALTYELPGGFRAEIRAEAIQRLYLEVDGEALLTVDGRLSPLGDGWFEGFKDLLLYNRREDLHRRLALKGVDVAVVSLGLWDGRAVHVLGAYFPDAAPAQIWVDKETLLPVRWLLGGAVDMAPQGDAAYEPGPRADQAEGRNFEIRYDRWQLFGKRRYPLRVQFFENHELVRTLAAEAVVIDAEVDVGLMDLEAARRLALPPIGDPPLAGEEQDPAVEEIHEAIDIFKKRFE